MPLPAALAAIPAVLQTGLGVGQLIKGSQINPQRPVYTPGSAAVNARETAIMAAMDNRFLRQHDAENRIRRSTADIIGQMQNSPNAAAMLPALMSSQNQSLNALSETASREQVSAVASFIAGENRFSAVQDQAFEYNQHGPYQAQADAKRSLVQGGIENIYGGVDNLSSMVVSEAMLGTNSGIGDLNGVDTTKKVKVNTGTVTSPVESNSATDILYNERYGLNTPEVMTKGF